MSIKIYGIRNCDTMKKAFNWFADNGIEYEFVNYRAEGITKAKVNEWLKKADAAQLVNTKSITFKSLSETDKVLIHDKKKATDIIWANPTMIKRPLVEIGEAIFLGYKPEEWAGAV